METVDISPYYEGGERERRSVAALIDKACSELGFFGLVGHRIPSRLVGEAVAVVEEFFSRPEAAKLAAQPEVKGNGRGYVPLEGERLSASTTFDTRADLKEMFSMGPPDVGSDPYYRFEPSGVAFAPNVWPPDVPELRTVLTRYYHSAAGLAADLFMLAAMHFGQPETWARERNDRHTSALRVLQYPARPAALPQQFGASPHTDYGVWTILSKRPGTTGLEAQRPDGTWEPVVAPAEGLVVNVGDLLMRWTGGRWLSALHRVVRNGQSSRRKEVSLALFHQPNWDVMVYPWDAEIVDRPQQAERFSGGAAERHYLGVPVGEFVFGKYKSTVAQSATERGEP